LYTSWLIVCIWFDRHTLEMDALRESHDVCAAELSAQLQVRLPFKYLIWAASHVQSRILGSCSTCIHKKAAVTRP